MVIIFHKIIRIVLAIEKGQESRDIKRVETLVLYFFPINIVWVNQGLSNHHQNLHPFQAHILELKIRYYSMFLQPNPEIESLKVHR